MSDRVRVLRVLEYDYESAEAMLADRKHWHIQGVYSPHKGLTIHSSVVSTILPSTEDTPFHFTQEGPGLT
jgi:hypothetical protein